MICLIQTYVSELCNNFKPSNNESEDAEADGVENFDPIISKDQTLIFLQLAESLVKQQTGPTYHIKMKNDVSRFDHIRIAGIMSCNLCY